MRMDNIVPAAADTTTKTFGWRGYALVIAAILVLGILLGGWIMLRYGDDVRSLADSSAAQAAPKPAPKNATGQNMPPKQSPPLVAPVQDYVPSKSVTLGPAGSVSAELAAAKMQSARAESILIVAAARRALDRGLPLGYIEPLLVQRFGESQGYAVKTIIAVSRKPVTLENLRIRLNTLEPVLLRKEKPDAGFWASLNAEVNQLVVVGDGSKPGQSPQDRMARALRLMDSERIDAAIIEVEALSGKTLAPRWLDDARRYHEARRALDVIETAALVEQPVKVD